MRTVVLGPPPAELEQLIARRRALGLDVYDEVWEGSYHMAPEARLGHAYLQDEVARVLRPYADAAGLTPSGPFNLGDAGDFRVPDWGYHRDIPAPESVYAETAAVVVEILSPDDETFEKLPFYASRDVDEVMVIDGARRSVVVMARSGNAYAEASRSQMLGCEAESIQAEINWL